MLNSPLILFVDGDADERERYSRYLSRSLPNFDIVPAATGKSGLDFCQRHVVDCVVLEIDLPDMSGFEVLMRLIPRVREPEIAVIMLTRLSNTYLLEAATRNGAQAALFKRSTSADALQRAILKAASTMTMAQNPNLPTMRGRSVDKPIRLS